VCKADNLAPSCADVTESGILNLPEPSGLHRPVMGMLYLYLFYTILMFWISPVALVFLTTKFRKLFLVFRGHAVTQWLRHCATNRKIAGSIPDGVTGIFH
jgi:hypothetical protein